MKTLNLLLNETRKTQHLRLREVAQRSGIDQALLSKFECGKRLPTEEQLQLLAATYQLEMRQLRTAWLAEKVLSLVQYEDVAAEVLAFAESRIEYLRSPRSLELPGVPPMLQRKLAAIDELKESWQSHQPLNQLQLNRMKDFFRIEYTFESNRIEGNTLTLQETALVVNEGLTIGGKSMQEHLEAMNHAEAVDFIAALATNGEDLNRRSLLELHSIILRGIDRENAGRYRKVPVRISGSRHEPPQPWQLDKLTEDYFHHYLRQKNSLHPVLLAAEMHERLVSIHPFIDGNGRTARLVMNLILLRNGYTIANLKGDNASRMAYYQALEKVQVDNEPVVFYQLVTDAVESSLHAHLDLV